MCDILKRGKFKVAFKKGFPFTGRSLIVQFEQALNSKADVEFNYKARYDISGQLVKLKRYTAYSAQETQAFSPRLL